MAQFKKKKMSPRQKMINLMYVVLMAMLALNVSSDVLNGFTLVSDKLDLSTQNSALINEGIYNELEAQYRANPAKVGVWRDRALRVREMSDSLYGLLDELKWEIVRLSDGKDADIHNIRNQEYLVLYPDGFHLQVYLIHIFHNKLY